MGFVMDAITSVGEVGLGIAEAAHAAPYVGEVVHGAEALYHTGAAVYDGVSGDRDGAIHHGVEAAIGAVGAIPGASEVVGAFQAGGAGASLLARGAAATGLIDIDQESIPRDAGDALGQLAVRGANWAFGEDEDRGHGTRGGEVGAGLSMVGGALGNVLMPGLGGIAGGWAGGALGNWLGGDGPTSGAAHAGGHH